MELLERGHEVAVLEAAWRDACAGRGSLVVLTGESGIGKTSLARHVAVAVVPPADVLWGVCDPLTPARPLGPLRDVVDQLGPSVGRLLTDGAPAHELFAAVYHELRAEPRLFVVDDLQWADQGTIDLLRFLVRRMAATSALVVATYRTDDLAAGHPLHALLGDVARSPSATRRELRPLSLDAVAAMIGDRPLDVSAVHRVTGGNAFFVTEIVTQATDTLPATVRDAVLARTATLGDDARRFLDLLACAPETIPHAVLPALLIGVPVLRTLADAGLIERRPRGVAFRHEIYRLAITSALPPGAEVDLHRRMLDALEAVGDLDAAVLAHHALGAGDAARVVRYGSLAATAAATAGAHTEAARFLEAAIAHSAHCSAAERAELLERLAGEQYLTNQLDDAITAVSRATRLREAEHDARSVGANHESLALYHWYNAHRTTAERHASVAVGVLEPGHDLVRLGHAYATEAFLAFQANDVERSRRFQDQAQRIARQVSDRQLEVRLETSRSAIGLMTGDLAGRERILAMVEQGMHEFDEAYSSGYSTLAYLDVEQRRLREAQQVLRLSLPLTVERDVPICRTWQLGVRARLRLLTGEWDDAVLDSTHVLSGTGAPLTRVWPHLVRGLVRLRRGEPDTDQDFEAAWHLAATLGEPLRRFPAIAAIAERSWLGDVADARLDEADEVVRRATSWAGTEWSLGDVALWFARLGRAVPAVEQVVPSPYRLALEGDHLGAASAWAELGCPYEQALALVASGAPEAAGEGMDILDRLGADAVATRLRRDLRQRGMAVVPGRRRSTTRANPAGLTDRQLQVLALLAEGLTNAELAARLYISPKTADHHVSAILTKLGVATRREAAIAARRLGVTA